VRADPTRLRLLNLIAGRGNLRLLLRGDFEDQPTEGLTAPCLPSPSRNRRVEARRQVDALSPRHA